MLERKDLTVKNLTATYYDGANDWYDLEFDNGKAWIAHVPARYHKEAATDEFYFENQAIIDQAATEGNVQYLIF